MCCFSGPVKEVADTSIFARASSGGRQFLVYSMRVDADEAMAMILPIPVPVSAADDAVRFINLEEYPEFFEEMRSGYPVPPLTRAQGFAARAALVLAVVEVGSFVASFVPSIADFSRLDERFRLPAEVWDDLPMYRDFGFAVFQFKEGNQKVHPMAFEFPRADPRQLFFPTVHIHDGIVHPAADFDHALFCQRSGGEEVTAWEETAEPAESFMKNVGQAQGIVDPAERCYRKTLRGVFRNKDVVVSA
ncbi:hypothetical protein SAMN05216486_10929 [bacterium JGI 053]|nr:hypothetical protein SAMN05216486_10929 [bacterium JGI 053]